LNEIFFNYCPEWIFTNRTLYLDVVRIIPEDPICYINITSEFNTIVLEGITRFQGGKTDFYFIRRLWIFQIFKLYFEWVTKDKPY
jgi:hypothetical protein